MAKVEIGYNQANAYHVGNDAYTVEVGIGRGQYAYHVGPGNFPYFTKEQAERLAERVSASGFIDTEFWTDGYCRALKASDVAPRPVLTLA
jgi:hypothetical protein